MQAWITAIVFAFIGMLAGMFCAHGVGINSMAPLICAAGGTLFAILGALLGATGDIVKAIREKDRTAV